MQSSRRVAYQPFYCEENIWHLCQSLEFANAQCGRVVFISNESRTVATFQQRAANPPSSPMVWDYHVVFLWHDGETPLIYDLDTTLAFPMDVPSYLDATFPDAVPPQFAPRFRVLDIDYFIKHFRSDRSHMRLPDGSWQAPPPPWNCIGTTDGTNLMEFVDVTSTTHGMVFSKYEFEHFARNMRNMCGA